MEGLSVAEAIPVPRASPYQSKIYFIVLVPMGRVFLTNSIVILFVMGIGCSGMIPKYLTPSLKYNTVGTGDGRSRTLLLISVLI